MKITIHLSPEGGGFKGLEEELCLNESGMEDFCKAVGISPSSFLPMKWEKTIEMLVGEEFIRIKSINSSSSNKTNERLRELLRSNGIRFREFSHRLVRTSEEAARERGTELKQGVKCLVAETREGVVAFLIPADERLDRKSLKKRFGNISLVSPQRAEELTGAKPGGIPPIGHGLRIVASERIFENDTVVFNSGFRNHSILMDAKDFRKILDMLGAEFFE